jgi:hypothetical protein
MFMAGTGDAEIELVATERIGSGDEITVDYGQAKELAYRLEESR